MTAPTLRGLGLLCAALALSACSPAFDWRDVRPEGTRAKLLFPCRPHAQTRNVALAGAPVPLALHACAAGEHTWGLAHADVGDPARVGPALAALRDSASVNLGTAPGPLLPQAVRGATPQPGSGRSLLVGKLPDGTAVQMQVLVFAQGTQVFQASVVGAALRDEAVETYFDSIHFEP